MKYLVFALFAIFLAACSTENTKITIEDKFISDSYKNNGENDNGVTVTMRYPVIKSNNEKLDQLVNNSVSEFILAPVYENDNYSEPRQMIDSVFASFQKLINEFPDYSMSWEFKRDVKVVYKSENVVTLDFTEEQFTGGAHPLTKKVFTSFDVKNAKEITLDELVDTSSAFFMELAEAKFREFQGISPDADMAAQDFFAYEGGNFSLSESFGIIGEDLIFYYNPYDIAPYYKGSSKFMINKRDLGDALKQPELLQ